MLKQHAKHRRKRCRKPVADQVRTMAASGLVEDQIALRLGIDKNELRARYIDAIKRGKATAAARELQIADMRREELYALDAILIAFDGGDWLGPDGRSDLWTGLDGKGARSPADAFAEWLSSGGHFV